MFNLYPCVIFFRAATVHIPKPPPSQTVQAIAARQKQRKAQEAKV